jgi:hypothetical protein
MPDDGNTDLQTDTRWPPAGAASSAGPPATRHRRHELLARVLLALALLTRWPAPALAQDAAGWLQKSQVARFPGRDYRARFAIVIREPDGTQLRRKGTTFRQSRDGGLADRLFVIRAPDHLRDLALLSQDRAREPAAQWLYIPAYRRARRVAVHAAGDGFVGSNFTYADLGRVRIEAGTHRVKGTTELRGRPCIVIESTTTDPTLPYARLVSTLDRESALPLRTEYHDATGRLTRVGTVDEIVAIGGWPTPVTLSMRDEATGGQSTIRLDDIRYDEGLDADLFTVSHLEARPSDD